jgi:hypothetical protein
MRRTSGHQEAHFGTGSRGEGLCAGAPIAEGAHRPILILDCSGRSNPVRAWVGRDPYVNSSTPVSTAQSYQARFEPENSAANEGRFVCNE